VPESHSLPQWNYYRMLEADLERSFRYIQPTNNHLDVYSDHFSMIILAACSEIENALQAFSQLVDCTPTPKKILQFHLCITSVYPSFCETQIAMPRFNARFTPWGTWSQTEAPDWWTNGYNKIKHDRINHPTAATFKHALGAMAGLQTLLLHYYRQFLPGAYMPAELEPHLLRLVEESGAFNNGGISWRWDLPDEIKAKRTNHS